MTDREYLTKRVSYIEKIAREKFATDLHVARVLFDDVRTGENSLSTIFETSDNRLYVLHEDSQPVTLAEVKHRMKLLGVEIGGILSPDGDKDYFDRRGRQIFMDMYPGRTEASDQEKSFYSGQSEYNPAIMLVSSIPGEIKRYSSLSSDWKVADKFMNSDSRAA